MFAKILFFPLLAIVVIGGLFSLRSALTGLGTSRARRMFKAALLAAALAAGGLWLMYGLDETSAPWAPWAAVGLLSVVVLPILAPVALVLLGFLWAKLSGKSIRWN